MAHPTSLVAGTYANILVWGMLVVWCFLVRLIPTLFNPSFPSREPHHDIAPERTIHCARCRLVGYIVSATVEGGIPIQPKRRCNVEAGDKQDAHDEEGENPLLGDGLPLEPGVRSPSRPSTRCAC